MANRSFQNEQYILIKREVKLWAVIGVPSGTTPVLQKWNYPVLGAGVIARTYTAAPTANTLPSGAAYPLQYGCGSEGVRSVARTNTGLWTIKLQDNYQRVLRVNGDMAVNGGLSNIVWIGENSTLTSMGAAGGSEIGVALLSSTATVADPTAAATCYVRIEFTLQDATEP